MTNLNHKFQLPQTKLHMYDQRLKHALKVND